MSLPKSLCFVDVETSGLNATYNRIIEIGILKVTDGELVKEYKTLLNPGTYIDPFIENMTGIKSQDLESAPYFEDVKDDLLEIFDDSVFVAHNVRFDYGFFRNEFKRSGVSFRSKHFCTVKLAKALYPKLGRYNLDNIISTFNIACANRHRAFDDAKVIWDFYRLAKESVDPQLFDQAMGIALKRPTLPTNIAMDTLDLLPETPGVYIFYGENGSILYIGKSINIRDRVLSHFSSDHLSSIDMKISQQVASVEHVETAGELGALLLESSLIKKHQPLFNRMLRHARKIPILLKKTDENGYNTVEVSELDDVDVSRIDSILGVFRSQKQTKDYLFAVAREYGLCLKMLGLEKSKGSCFYYHLGKCEGACVGKEASIKYNLRFDEGFYSKKIRQWQFDSPILIKEEGLKNEAHVVDKWCYLGSIKNNSERLEDLDNEYRFDYDTYKILKRFILDPKNENKISLLRK
jgi:DNA polymerase-3 subunit epsilon